MMRLLNKFKSRAIGWPISILGAIHFVITFETSGFRLWILYSVTGIEVARRQNG